MHGQLETVVKGNNAFKFRMEIDFIPAVSHNTSQLALKKHNTAALSYCHSCPSECCGCTRTLDCVLINGLRGEGWLFILICTALHRSSTNSFNWLLASQMKAKT